MSRQPVSSIGIAAASIVGILLSREVGFASPAGDPASPPSTKVPWSTIKTANFTIYFHKDFAEGTKGAKLSRSHYRVARAGVRRSQSREHPQKDRLSLLPSSGAE
jgi:hypothetical protein